MKGIISMFPDEYSQKEEIFRRCLFEALIDLMQNTSIDRLTVKSIVTRAHVSRAAFYRRYQDKYDLLNQSYERILEHTLFTVHSGTSWREAIFQIYKVLQENVIFFKNAFSSEDQNSLKNYIYSRTLALESEILQNQGIDITQKAVQYRLHGYVSGGLALTVMWIQDGAQLPLEDMVEILVEMVPERFKEYFV